MFLLLVGVCLCILRGANGFGDINKKNWDYTIISVNSTSSNQDAVSYNLEVIRVGRGDYAISGKIVVNADVDDNYFVEVLLWRSASGNNQYKLQPFKVNKQTINEYLNGIYKNMLAESLKSCSNAPQPDGDNPIVTKKMTYILEKCVLSTEMLPSHMQPGYYKLQMIGTGPVEYVVEILAEIETKM